MQNWPRVEDLLQANGSSMRWGELVMRIRALDAAAAEPLFAELSDLLRPILRHTVDPQSLEDRLQDVLAIIAGAIRTGELRDPLRLTGFALTVTRRQKMAYIRSTMLRRRYFGNEPLAEPSAPVEQSPEVLTQRRERSQRLAAVLRRLRDRDRQILIRFYLHEQSADHICREMHLTGTQFRLYKSRALARCSEMVRGKEIV